MREAARVARHNTTQFHPPGGACVLRRGLGRLVQGAGPRECRTLWRWLVPLVFCAACQPALRVTVQSGGTTNGGKPLYMMVATAEEKQALLETYEAAAERLFKDPRDKRILHRMTVFPGNHHEFSLMPPEDEDLALYVFFTDPADENWRHVVRRPVPAELVVELGKFKIDRVIMSGE